MGPIISAVATALSGVVATVFGLFANILGIISGAFLWLSVNIFNWVLSPDFISLSYTDPSKNPFLEVGWSLTRDFANIIIVLALVVIGLGTALRLAGYQAQKALPTLILIALLINFTPVICGLIVDAANILMSFFVGEGFAGGNSFINASINQFSNISSLAGGLKFWDPIASQEATAAAIGSYISAFFNFYAAVIYLLFAFLFAFRYIAIWVLVILSPLAFACYILPNTRSVWTQWWKQFMQWSFIGVIAAFFLYLGDHFLMVTKSPDFIHAALKEVGNAPGLSSILNNIMPYGIALVFLTIGLMLALSSSAAGANEIINFAQKKGGQAGKWMGDRGKAFARSKVPEGVRRWADRQVAAKNWGEGEKGIKGWAKRRLGAPISGLRRVTGGVVTGALNEKLEFAKAYEKAKGQGTALNMKDLRGPSSETEKVATSKAMAEKNQWPGALDPEKFGKDAYTEGELMKRYEKARNMEENDTADALERSGIHYAPSFGAIQHKLHPKEYDENGLTTEDKTDRHIASYLQKIVRGFKTENHIKQAPKKWQNEIDLTTGKEAIEYAVTSPSFGNRQYEAASLSSPGFQRSWLEFCKRKGPEWLTGFNKDTGMPNAPNAARILSSNAANAYGMGMPGINVKEMIQKHNAMRMVKEYPFLAETQKTLEELNRAQKDFNSAKKIKNNQQIRDAQEGIKRIEKILEGAKRTSGPEEQKKIEELERIMKSNRKRRS